MIDNEYLELFYRPDAHKKLLIRYDTGEITNNELHQESFELQENLCSEENIVFGSCEAGMIKFTVSNIFESLKGKWLDVSLEIAEYATESLKIGRFKVYSDIPTVDRLKRNVEAYDALYDIIHADVAEWYHTLLPENTSTTTLKEFRNSFFEYFGIEQEETVLPNDDILITKSINPEELSGKMVISSICEINGCFGHMDREGRFRYVFLQKITSGLYPSLELYPSENIYPSIPNGKIISSGSYIPPCEYESYITEEITGLVIRQEENDIGCQIGVMDNVYIIEGNFLAYGKNAEELEEIGSKIFEKIVDVAYRPFTTKAVGNPCLEVGDIIHIRTRKERVESYILQRTLTGIQCLRDTYTAEGEQYIPTNVNSTHKSIVQLQGKTNILTRTVDETKLEMADLGASLKSTISATASQIRTEIANTESGLQSQITQTATQIRSEISNTESALNSSITQTATQIRTEISDVESSLSSSITQTTTQIRTEIANTESSLQSSITQTATQIRSEISSTKDGLQSQITQNASSITSEIKRATEAEGTLSTKITQTDTKIRADISATYETKAVVETKVNSALNSAEGYTDTALASYSTTTEMNSAIAASANSINLSVSSKISETVDYIDTSLASYVTTTELNSSISLSESSILSTVSAKYYTKSAASSDYSELYSQIEQTESSISSKVSKNGVISAINQSSESISISASKITISGATTINANFYIDSSGNLIISDSTDNYTAYVRSDGLRVQKGSSFLTIASNGISIYDSYDSQRILYMAGGYTWVYCDRLVVDTYAQIDGHIVIHSGNISDYISDLEARVAALEAAI